MAKPQKRNFCTNFYTPSLEGNYERSLKDSSEKTRRVYLGKFQSKVIDVHDYQDFNSMLDKIQEKWLSGEYSHSSVRQYKASIMFGLSLIYHYQKNHTISNKVPHLGYLSKNITASELSKLYDKCKTLGEGGDRKKLEHEASKKLHTSSVKDKRFDSELLAAVLDYTTSNADNLQRYKLLRLFLKTNSIIGLRPSEYENCIMVNRNFFYNSIALHKILGISNLEQASRSNIFNIKNEEQEKGNPILIVKNAKDSHGRACGEYRFLSLNILNDRQLLELDELLHLLQQKRNLVLSKAKEKKNAKPIDYFEEKIMYPLQKQLYRILTKHEPCQDIINRLHQRKMSTYKYNTTKKGTDSLEPTLKHPTLYSTRHQAVANAKAAKVDAVIIAAAFGHASILTAEEHYGLGYYGNNSGGVMPLQISINAVVDRLTPNQEKMIGVERNIQTSLAKSSATTKSKGSASSGTKYGIA